MNFIEKHITSFISNMLKFPTEKYLRNTLTKDELHTIASNLRKTYWKDQKESGIDFISSNDFSFYDNLLDTTVFSVEN